MKKIHVVIFLLIVSVLIIPFIKVNASINYVDSTYQINESHDDAYYLLNFIFDNDDDNLLVKSNLYDSKTGLVFDNITILANATFYEAYISFYVNDSYTDDKDYWSTIYGIYEDNVTSFGNFSYFNSLEVTSNYVNWNLKDMEGLDKWVNSSNLADILNRIRNRSGWSSGNNIGVMLYSTQSSDAYRIALSYDGNSTYAPKLYIKYRYLIVDAEEGCEFVKEYKDYDIYECLVGGHDLDFMNNTPYNVSATYYTDFVKWGDGANLESRRRLWYSELLKRFIWFGEYNDKVVYLTSGNGTDYWDFYDVNVGVSGLTSVHIATWLWEDNDNCYVHIVFSTVSSGSDLRYYMIEINSDGSFNPISSSLKTIVSVGGGDILDSWSVTVDTSGYAWAVYSGSAPNIRKVSKNKYKNGDWTHETAFPYSFGSYGACVSIISLSSDKVLLVWYSTSDGYKFYGQEYDSGWGSVESKTVSSPYYSWMFQLVRFSNDDVLVVYDANAPTDLMCVRRNNDGTWAGRYTVYDNPQTTDRIHFDVTVDENDIAIVFWTPDLNNPVQNYVIYSNSSDKGNSWGSPYSWIDQTAGSINDNPITVLEEKDNMIPVGWRFDDAPNVLRIAYLGIAPAGEGESHYFIYDEDGDLVASCFDDIDDVEDHIDDLVSERIFSGNTLLWMMGLLGLIMMPLGFILFVTETQSGNMLNGFRLLMIFFLIGMTLFISWMWGWQ